MTKTGETKVSVLVSLFNWIQKTKVSSKKKIKFRKFLDSYCDSTDYFSALRLILPSLDRERGSYGLKESVLATCLIDALGMARDSEDALRLINWRKGNAKNVGNFPLVAAEILQRRQGMISGGLTIKELNDLLDQLASSENRAEKTLVLSTLIKKTNAQEMKWIIMIILKDLKLGISEKSIFHEFHPDAEDLFNVTCDLKLVCEKLRDRSQRHKRQDIEVGKAVRPQLAMRVNDVQTAWKKLHGKEVLVECKFDGDRIQIHKNGAEVHYFSRNFLDHSEYKPAMSDIIVQNILADRCILDGEMLVWDTSLNRFAEFGSNQEIAKAARDGLDSDRQLCYVAFDILYVGDTSVIHQSLKERHELLRKVLKPLKGRLEILVPNGGLNTLRSPGEPRWSLIAYSMDNVEKFFKETIENRDEGIILKDLGSKWEPSDRSGKWLKLKPEYIHTGSDLDVIIIGGYYGSGRGGGVVTQFLVALAERPAPDTYPRRFISFCRVGTGLTDDELEAVVTKLKPYFRKNEYPKKAPPSCYQVTNNSKERPDVWIDSPEKSIILSITSDIRTITSEVFAAPYSLRFPRIDKVRHDKPWHECLDVQSFVELVHSSNGTTHKGKEYGGPQDKQKRVKSSRKGGKNKVSIVPSHFTQTDVSNIKGETLIFSNMMFYFTNVPPTHSLDLLHKMVVENGGTFSMNLNNSVTHCVAAENKGIKFQAAKRHGDIFHYSWFVDCCKHKRLVPLQPKYFLHISNSSKTKLQEEVDAFSDSYYWDLDLGDIKQLLSNINGSEDPTTVDYYKKKYCPEEKWSLFHGCCIYLYCSPLSLKPEWGVLLGLTLRRLKLEVSFAGGKVCDSLTNATHLVVFLVPGSDMDFNCLIESFNARERQLLLNKRLHIVRSEWLEECLKREEKLLENPYSLKASGMEELYVELCKDVAVEEDSSKLEMANSKSHSDVSDSDEKQKGSKHGLETSGKLASPKRENDSKRKRGRPVARSTKRGGRSVNQPHRTRGRAGKNPSKIREDDSDNSCSADGKEIKEVTKGNHSSHGMVSNDIVEEAESSVNDKTAEQQIPKDIKRGEEKLEVMTDPVQAMLLDMIPSLGKKKVEENDKPSAEDLNVGPVKKKKVAEEEEKPSVEEDLNVRPIKKKKVSYKDVAGELLKDW